MFERDRFEEEERSSSGCGRFNPFVSASAMTLSRGRCRWRGVRNEYTVSYERLSKKSKVGVDRLNESISGGERNVIPCLIGRHKFEILSV